MLLERGQVRLSQNSAHHQQHNKEIMLGRILGPISDRHRYHVHDCVERTCVCVSIAMQKETLDFQVLLCMIV